MCICHSHAHVYIVFLDLSLIKRLKDISESRLCKDNKYPTAAGSSEESCTYPDCAYDRTMSPQL